jgi:plasmid maintenance system killer protein
MIVTFKHKGLELFFRKSSYKGIPAQYALRIERMLDRLDASKEAWMCYQKQVGPKRNFLLV